MKKIYLVILMAFLGILPSMAQKAYEMEVMNLVQINETAFTFDVRMRNANPADPFVIELIQWQFSFNTAMMNGGRLENAYLTYVEGTTDLVGIDIIPESPYFSTNQVVIQWLTAALGDNAQTTFFGDSDWKRIGTFKVQLRNSGNTAFHPFAEVVPSLSFVPSQVIVNWCNYTTSGGLYYRDGAHWATIANQTLTNSLVSRKLAGYCFSGTGSWSTAARWNNVTALQANTLPGSTNNALVVGSATLDDNRTLTDLTIAPGAYLDVAPTGRLTADNVYNHNLIGTSGEVVIAGWDFQSASTGGTTPFGYPYLADFGTSSNLATAPFTTTATKLGAFDFYQSDGTIAPRATTWFYWDEDELMFYYYDWHIRINTTGFQNLRLSSKQRSVTTGPLSFKLQWSTNGTVWTDVSGGTVTVDATWTTGVVNNLSLPEELSNKDQVYIRWLNTSSNGTGSSAIDDISITGEPLPTGMRIESSASGTGSVIHANTGVEASVQRYLPGGVNAWHMISAPVSGMTIASSGWNPGAIGAPNDMYLWNEPSPGTWVNFKNQDGSGGDPTFPAANGGGVFATSRGYIVNYNEANPTKEFVGPLHAGTVNVNLTVTPAKADWTWRAGWNLIGNPYASSLDFGEITTSGILAENYAHVYDPAFGSGAGGYVQVTTISPGQGFFVKAAAGSGKSVLALTHEAQAHGGAFCKQGTSGDDDRLVLRLSDGQNFDETKVYVNEASVPAHDFYDATKLFSYNTLAPQLYTRIEEERPLVVNSIPAADEGVAIPLSARIKKTGLFTLSIVETAGELTGQPVILEDLFTKSYHQLDESPYVFSSTEGDNADRFKLVFGSVGVTDVPLSDIKIWCFDAVLHVRNSGSAVVEVINMAGQVVERQVTSTNDIFRYRLHHSSGSYLVRVVEQGRVATALIVL